MHLRPTAHQPGNVPRHHPRSNGQVPKSQSDPASNSNCLPQQPTLKARHQRPVSSPWPSRSGLTAPKSRPRSSPANAAYPWHQERHDQKTAPHAPVRPGHLQRGSPDRGARLTALSPQPRHSEQVIEVERFSAYPHPQEYSRFSGRQQPETAREDQFRPSSKPIAKPKAWFADRMSSGRPRGATHRDQSGENSAQGSAPHPHQAHRHHSPQTS